MATYCSQNYGANRIDRVRQGIRQATIVTAVYSVVGLAIAYFCGAGAYVAEILILTDGFRRKVPQKELFMAYCFGPLYILLGLSYLLEA